MAQDAQTKLNQRETEFLLKKVRGLPEGRLKTALMGAIHPDGAAAAAKIARRRGSVLDIHALNSAMLSPMKGGFDITKGLDLGGLEIGKDGALQLAELLGSPALRQLQHLDLSCNKLTDLGSDFTGVTALASALRKNRVMTSLNLARNSLFKNGAVALARALRENSSLQFLDLSRNNLRAEGLEAIAKAIDPSVNEANQLVMLDLSANNLTNFAGSPDGALALGHAIASHGHLTSLDLSHSRMSKQALGAVVGALRKNKMLVDVRLDDNKVDLDTAHRLAEALAVNRTLTRLGLYNNSIYNDGALAIARVLARSSTLQLCDMRKNFVSKDGRVDIAALIRPDAPSVKAALAAASNTGVAAAVAKAGNASGDDADGGDSDDDVPAALQAMTVGGAGSGAGAGAEAGEVESKGVEGEVVDSPMPAIAGARAPSPVAVDDSAVDDVDLNGEEVVLHNTQSGLTVWL